MYSLFLFNLTFLYTNAIIIMIKIYLGGKYERSNYW